MSEAASAGCPPLMAQSLTRTFIQDRLNRSGAVSPDARIDSRLDGRAWDPGANGAAPITLNPNGGVTEFGTSLSQWGSWMVKTDIETINEAKPLLEQGGVKAPKPVRLGNRRMDVWTQARATPLMSGGEKAGQAYTSSVGADYKPVPGLLMGTMIQLDTAQQDGMVPGGSVSGQGYMAGPYAAMKISPNVTLDASAAWGTAEDSVSVGSSSSRIETSRRRARARLKGDWTWSKWRLTPSASIESVGETASGAAGQVEAEAESERVSVGPRLSRQVDIGDKTTLEPFVHMNSSVDLDTAGALLQGGAGGVDPHKTFGAGLSLSQADEYRFEATADVDDPGGDLDREVRGGVKLTIPLN